MTDITDGMPRLDFHMTADGKPVTAQDFRGKVVALYFGYTHCPDVCPATLANLTDMAGKVHRPICASCSSPSIPTATPMRC